MRTLTNREKRTVRLAAAAISIYLAIFYGRGIGQYLETRRSDYQQLVKDAQSLQLESLRYQNNSARLQKLKETFGMDPAKLSLETLVGEASAAIQEAAQSCGVKLGPIREAPARPAARELASMQFEGTGLAQSLTQLLYRLKTLGFPLILDSVQVQLTGKKPGMVKLILQVVMLDYSQWQEKEVGNA